MGFLEGKIVLIAEPDPLVASGLGVVIGDWGGVTCAVVPSAAALLDPLMGAAPDLLLVNADLLGGVDAARFFLSTQYVAPTVAMTTARRPPIPQDDAMPCLEIPFTIDALRSAVVRALHIPRRIPAEREGAS